MRAEQKGEGTVAINPTNPNDVLWYNSGTCYDRIGVKTKKAANKVKKAMKGKTVNGGMFHGMSLGNPTISGKGKDKHYDIMC